MCCFNHFFTLSVGVGFPPCDTWPWADERSCSGPVTYTVLSLGRRAWGHHAPCRATWGYRVKDQELWEAVLQEQEVVVPLVLAGGCDCFALIILPFGGQWSLLLRDKQERCLVPVRSRVVWLWDLSCGGRMGRGTWLRPLKALPVWPDVKAAHNSGLNFRPYIHLCSLHLVEVNIKCE